MSIKLAEEPSYGGKKDWASRSCFSWAVQILPAALLSLLRALWIASRSVRGYEQVDCEKGPVHYVHMYETQARLAASLKRRGAADAAFEAQVMALLAPVKARLAELTQSLPVGDPHLDLETTARAGELVSDLPPALQMFYGRDGELAALVRMFTDKRPLHAAIVGPPGVGKSALALALLYRPEIVRKFGKRRFLVRIDTYASQGVTGVLRCIAAGLRLPYLPPNALQPAVLAALSASPSDFLIVLDDFDDVHHDSNHAVGAFLSRLSALPRVSLLLALRGPHAPLKSASSCTIPLAPLPLFAARALFRSIADAPSHDADTEAAVDTLLLRHAGCIPRAVVFLAQQAQYEPLPLLLARCAEEDEADEAQDDGGAIFGVS